MGQDHQAVFVGLECAKEGVRHIPNEGGLFLDVPAHRGQLFIRGHIKIALSVSFWDMTKSAINSLTYIDGKPQHDYIKFNILNCVCLGIYYNRHDVGSG